MRPLKYIHFILALLLAHTALLAQRYPCLDYGRINRTYECEFDLQIGTMIFTGGIIHPEKTLTPAEIDGCIEEAMAAMTIRRGGRAGNVPDPCTVADSLNKAMGEMRMALGNENFQALNRLYDQAIRDFSINVASAMAPSFMSVIANLSKGDIGGLALDAMGPAGNAFQIFYDLLGAAVERDRIMDAIKKNKDAIEKGREAEQVMDEFYNDIYNAVKKKMGNMRWTMTMRSLDKFSQTRTFMGVKVPVEYTASVDMKKMVTQSDKFEGSYEGAIEIKMEMMSRGDGNSFDDRFPKQENPIKERIRRYHAQWFQPNPSFEFTPNAKTTYKLTANLEKADVTAKFGECRVKWGSIKEEPELHFDYNLKAAGRTKALFGVEGRSLHDFKLTSADTKKVTAGTVNHKYIVLSPTFSNPPYRSEESSGLLEGWHEEFDIGGNDFMEPLKSSAYIIIKPKGMR